MRVELFQNDPARFLPAAKSVVALVIGAAGFLGRHLAQSLAREQWLVVGGGRGGAPDGWPYGWVSCDLRSTPSVLQAVAPLRQRT